jgi:hypothetical protein
MTRAILLAILLIAPADAGPFSRSRSSYNSGYNNTTRPPVQYEERSRITGNVADIPQEPEWYTIAVFPDNYRSNADSQELLRALGTDPTLVALRRNTCLQTYALSDPDFQHRFNPQETCKRVYEGGTAMIVVDRDGGLVWWLQGGSPRQYAADIEREGVLDQLQLSGSGLLRIRRPKVCTPETCPPNGPTITPNPTQPDDGPLRPIPSPIDIVDSPEEPTVPPAAPPVTPTIPPPTTNLEQQITQLNQQLVNIKIDIAAAQAAAEKPFYIRVVDPRG